MNPFDLSSALFKMMIDIGNFFQFFFTWNFTIPGTQFTVTAFGLYAGLGGSLILAIIIRAIVRAVAL